MKKNRFTGLVLILIFIAVLAISFSACSGITLSSNNTIIFYTSNDLNAVPYASIRSSGNKLITFPSDPALSGYAFAGWYDESNKEVHEYTYLDKTIDSEIKLYAKFLPLDTIQDPCTITFETNGGSSVATKDYAFGAKLNKDEITTTKNGYTFMGYFKDAEFTNAWNVTYDRIWQPLTLYAKWEFTGYTINYVLDGGKNNKDNPAKYTTELEIFAPEKLGYAFINWYLDADFNTVFDPHSEHSGDITLYAKWQKETYEITYSLDADETLNGTMPTSYDVDTVLNLPTASKEGYDFVGWFKDESKGILLDTTSKNTGNLHLTPSFREKKYYITYVLNGGTNVGANKGYVTFRNNVVRVFPATKVGYDFTNWYLDEELTDIFYTNTAINKDITLYADWALHTYNITYHLEPGVVCDTSLTTYDVEHPYTLPNPTFEDKYFSGWFLDSELTQRYVNGNVYAQDLDLYPLFVESELINPDNYYITSSSKGILVSQSLIASKNLCIPLTANKPVISVKYDGVLVDPEKIYYDSVNDYLVIANEVLVVPLQNYRYLVDIEYEDFTIDHYSYAAYDSNYSTYDISIADYIKNDSLSLDIVFASSMQDKIDYVFIDGDEVDYNIYSNRVRISSDIMDNYVVGRHLVELMTDKGLVSKNFNVANNSFFYPYNVKASVEVYPYVYITWDYDFDADYYVVDIDGTGYSSRGSTDLFDDTCFNATGLLKVANQTYQVTAVYNGENYASPIYTFKYDLYLSKESTSMPSSTRKYLDNTVNVYGKATNTLITSYQDLYDILLYLTIYNKQVATAFDSENPNHKAVDLCLDFEIGDIDQLTFDGDYYYTRDPETGDNIGPIPAEEKVLSNANFVMGVIMEAMSLLPEANEYGLLFSGASAQLIRGQCYRFGIQVNAAQTPEINRTKQDDVERVTNFYSITSTTHLPEDYRFPIEIYNNGNADVYTSTQLYLALENGYNPIPRTQEMITLYNKVKTVLRDILDENMNQYEQVLAIYQWICTNVDYDHAGADEAEARSAAKTYHEVYGWSSFFMEGVFDLHLAVCNGIVAAYSAMLNTMGIPCIKVSGLGDGGGHTWAEIYVGGVWYVSEPTWGNLRVETASYDISVLDYEYAFMTNAQANVKHERYANVHGDCRADDTYFDYAKYIKYDIIIPTSLSGAEKQAKLDALFDVVIAENEPFTSGEYAIINYEGDNYTYSRSGWIYVRTISGSIPNVQMILMRKI